MAMKITDILTRNVITVSPETTLDEAAGLMSENRISCLIAVSEKIPVGILTEADLVHICRLGVDTESAAVSEFMSHPVISAHSHMDIFEVYDFLLEKNMRHLVVVNSLDELEGVVTLSDILKATAFDDYLHAKQICDVMRSPIISLPAEQSVQAALEKMDAVHVSCVVVTKNSKAVGIFTERDAARLIAAKQNASQLSLAETMTSPLKTLKPEEPLILASTTMREIGTRRLVIVDETNEPVGIITQFDVIRGLEGVSVRHFKALYDKSELKLEESNRLLAEKSELERIVAASPGVLYRCEWQGDLESGVFRPTYFSPQTEGMLGYLPADLLYPDWWKKHVHPDDQAKVQTCLKEIAESGERNLIYRVGTKSGGWLWILDHARVNKSSDGRPLEMVGSWLDISERRRSEEESRASEEKYRRLVESSNDAIFVAEAETGILIDANEQAEKLLGLPREKIIGMHQTTLHPPQEADRYARIFAGHAHDERSFIPDVLVRRADGRDVPVDISANKIEIGGKAVLQGVFRDITERKAAEEKLRLTQFALDQAVDAIYWMTPVGRFVYVNQAASNMLGYSRDELLKMSVADIDPALPDGVPPEMAKATKDAGSGRVETSHRCKDGRLLPVEIMVGYFEFGNQEYHCSFVRDISERKESESRLLEAVQALEVSEGKLKSLIQTIPDLIWLKDPDGLYLSCNHEFEKFFGASEAEIVGKSDYDFIDKELADFFREKDKAAIAAEKPTVNEERIQFAEDGHWALLETIKTPMRDSEGNLVGVLGIGRDITERLESEQQMRLLESAVASVNESIIITDPDGIIVYVNPAFTTNTGFSYKDALGKTPVILNSKQQSKAFYEKFWNTIQNGEPWDGRILDRKKDGTIFPVHLSVAPIVDADQNITHFVAVHDDLSEAETMQKQMMQSQKMEAVATMVGGVAHDFNNLLASIVGNLYLMRNHHKDDVTTVNRIRGMETSVQHGAQLIQQMLTFARKDRTEMHAMDLKGFIKEAHKLAKATVPENINFSLDYPIHDEIWVKGDGAQLQQVLLNLVANAVHAVRACNHAEIQMRLKLLTSDETMRLKYPEMVHVSKWCCLSCQDNGIGMDSKTQERVFEPFFTSKPIGQGTGLGLSMVYGAVQNHQGFIDLQSKPNQGTEISIYLPLYQAGPVELSGEDENEDEDEVDGSDITILLVDDEPSLRQVLTDVLRHSHFRVLQAVDGLQAVERFREQHDEISLVLMDVVMPNKGGVTAAREIREIDATVPIIFQTGYGETTQLEAAAAIPHSESIQKPVQISELMKLIMDKIKG